MGTKFETPLTKISYITQLLSKIRDLSDRKQIGEDLPLKAENGSEQIDRVAYPRLKTTLLSLFLYTAINNPFRSFQTNRMAGAW